MRTVLLALSFLAACGGGSKKDRCTKIRDQALPVMEKNVKDALGAVGADQRAEIEAQGARELAAFKAKFVEVCAAQDDATVACLEEGAKAPATKVSDACQDKANAVWEQLYQP